MPRIAAKMIAKISGCEVFWGMASFDIKIFLLWKKVVVHARLPRRVDSAHRDAVRVFWLSGKEKIAQESSDDGSVLPAVFC